MKRIIFALILVFSGIGITKAQEFQTDYNIIDFIDYINRNDAVLNTKKPYTDIAGTPYITEEFIDGQVITNDNTIYKGSLRYNIYADEMEFLINDVVYWFENSERIEYIMIGEQRFIFILEGKKFNKGDFYEQLEQGKCQLLLRRKVVLMPAVPAKPYQDPKPARFEPKLDTYYLKMEAQAPTKISGRKDLEKILKDKSAQVKAFMKEHNTSINKPEDLKKLIAYYNAL